MNYQKVRNQPEYVLDGGTYFLKDEYDNVMLGTLSIWMMINVDSEMCTILKHGSKERIQAHYDIYQSKFREHAKRSEGEAKEFALEMANDLIMLDVSALPLDEINHALASTGYIGKLLKQYGIVK